MWKIRANNDLVWRWSQHPSALNFRSLSDAAVHAVCLYEHNKQYYHYNCVPNQHRTSSTAIKAVLPVWTQQAIFPLHLRIPFIPKKCMRLLNLLTLIQKNQNTHEKKNTFPCHFVHHKSQTDCLRYEPKSIWSVAGNGTDRYKTWIPHRHNNYLTYVHSFQT